MIQARYVEINDEYRLTLYGPHPTVTDVTGLIYTRPEWLTNIVMMATVGEHFMRVPEPPPDRILWFFIDEDCNLAAL